MRLRSTRVVTPNGVAPATIHVEGERVVAIEADGVADVDYGELVIMPGIVDSHVHVNEPGRTEWEGFETATRAAVAGGTTTIVDMPLNSIPPTTTLAALETKRDAMRGKCLVDVELWGGIVPGNTRELRPMLEAGARGFKCFLVDSGVDEFPHVDEDQLREAARELARTGAPILVHAELPEFLHPPHGDPARYATWLESRPKSAEDAAIALVCEIARETGARMHIVHLSSASALPMLAKSSVTAETTPHYLHFAAERIPDGHNEYKCAPPIREEANREQLWRGLADGTIGLVVSDHSPCTPELKRGTMIEAWGGIASMQFVLPITWTNASRRGHTLSDLARWICEGPARLARLERKGAIEVGRDADFAIWSPDETFVIEPSLIEHRHKVTPYLGEELRGVVKETWVRGSRRVAE
jgi:allantoinase